MEFKRYFTWGYPQSWTKWVEAVGLTAAFLAAGYYFNDHDLFFKGSQFPWLWFAPVLIALRYGMAPGIVSVSTITILSLVLLKTGLLPYDLPASQMLGGLLLTMICGQFGTVWLQRLSRADRLSEHAVERAQQVSRAYFMVRLSHDRLEQNLISKPVTLRQAMVDLRSLLVRHGGDINPLTGGELLAILSHYCGLDSAAIHQVERGRISSDPAASCGKGARLEANDVLLRTAMESGNTSYQSVESMQPGLKSDYLVVAPMASSSGEMRAVLIVTEMPFMALNRENLQTMGVLLSYFVEHSFATKGAEAILAVYPGCPAVFALELIKMHRLNRELGIDSTLAMLHIQPTPREKEMVASIEEKQRGLDHVWRLECRDGSVLITLMPFSGVAGGEGYVARIEKFLNERFGIERGSGIASVRLMQLAASLPPVEHLNELLKLEGIDGKS